MEHTIFILILTMTLITFFIAKDEDTSKKIILLINFISIAFFPSLLKLTLETIFPVDNASGNSFLSASQFSTVINIMYCILLFTYTIYLSNMIITIFDKRKDYNKKSPEHQPITKEIENFKKEHPKKKIFIEIEE